MRHQGRSKRRHRIRERFQRHRDNYAAPGEGDFWGRGGWRQSNDPPPNRLKRGGITVICCVHGTCGVLSLWCDVHFDGGPTTNRTTLGGSDVLGRMFVPRPLESFFWTSTDDSKTRKIRVFARKKVGKVRSFLNSDVVFSALDNALWGKNVVRPSVRLSVTLQRGRSLG